MADGAGLASYDLSCQKLMLHQDAIQSARYRSSMGTLSAGLNPAANASSQTGPRQGLALVADSGPVTSSEPSLVATP